MATALLILATLIAAGAARFVSVHALDLLDDKRR